MKTNYFLITACVLLLETFSYGQGEEFYLDFEGVNPLSNLPTGVTNVDGTNTVRVKNNTDYAAIPNTVESDGNGGNELFLDYHGYLRMDLTDTSTGFSVVYDYRMSNVEDADWWLGFLTFIGNEGVDNKLEKIQIKQYWVGQLNFANVDAPNTVDFRTADVKVVVTCSSIGDIKVYINNVVVLDILNSASSYNMHTWTNAGLLLSFKGDAFDGTNVTPEGDYASNSRDARVYVDNISLFDREVSVSEVNQLFNDGNNTLQIEDKNVLNNQVGVYPNPVTDILNFSSEVESTEIYNILGAKIIALKTINSSIDVSVLIKGTYIIKCFDVKGNIIDIVRAIKL
jgi:hypothetical protein